jgi:hypothetical protein
MRDFLIIKNAYERKGRMLVLSAYFTHMDLAKPLREHLEHALGLDHGCIDLTSVADIKAELSSCTVRPPGLRLSMFSIHSRSPSVAQREQSCSVSG